MRQGSYPTHPYQPSYPPGHSPAPAQSYPHPQRPQNLILEGRDPSQLADPYQPSPTAQSPYLYKPPPRYSFQNSPAQSPHPQYPGYHVNTPTTGFPAPQGPPPYGAPSTPTDSGYYGSIPNMHPVPSPVNRGGVSACVLYLV